MLTKLAELLEKCRITAKRSLETSQPALTASVKSGETRRAPAQENAILRPGKECQMLADLKRQLVFPREIMTATLRPDIMWSVVERRVVMIEPTIPWEEGMTAAHERKHLKYSDLAVVSQRWHDGLKSAESGEGAGRRGREGELLTVVSEEGEHLGANTPVKAAAGGGGETSPKHHCPPPGDVLVQGAVSGGFQLTTLQLPKLALEEVRQAERPKQEPTPNL